MIQTEAKNIFWHSTHVERKYRNEVLKQQGITLWFTGLPASGKSTTAFTLEHELIWKGYLAYVLDEDNVRHGMNKYLGFSREDRKENIRRIAETAKLFADAGLIVITSFISPYRCDRDMARQLHDESSLPFIEIFMDTTIDVCELRDPKGMYAASRKGKLKGFTGVDDSYEPPLKPEIAIKTTEFNPSDCVFQILVYLEDKGLLKSDKS